MLRRTVALLLLLGLVPAGCGRVAANHRLRRPLTRAVYGFYVEDELPVAPSSYATLVAHHRALTVIAPFWFQLSPDGSGRIAVRSGPGDKVRRALIKEAHRLGVRVEAVVHNLLYRGGWTESRAVGVAALRHPATFAAAIQHLVQSDGFDGVHLDLEVLPASARPSLANFVALLNARLKPRTLTVSVAPPLSGPASRWGWTGSFDYRRLARASDGLVVMFYDQHGEDGPPGPIASNAYLKENLDLLRRLVPRGKILMGIGAFGFDWPPGGAGGYLSYAGAIARARAARVSVRSDTRLGAAWFRYKAPDGLHSVYFEDARTWAAKLKLARRYRLAGIAIWRLGMEDPAVWRGVLTYKRGR